MTDIEIRIRILELTMGTVLNGLVKLEDDITKIEALIDDEDKDID
jgi:hypothetical protein